MATASTLADRATPSRAAGVAKKSQNKPPPKETVIARSVDSKVKTKPVAKKSVVSIARKTAATKTALKQAPPKKQPANKEARPPAKNAPSKKFKTVKAQPLGIAMTKNLADLLYRARAERLSSEVALSDIVIVAADDSLAADSLEMQTVAALNLGQFAAMVADGEPGPKPEIKIVRQLGAGMAMRANETALRLVRRSSPGLRMFASAYLYPQYLRSLGEELSDHTLAVTAGTSVQKVVVRIQDALGNPVADVSVRAMVDWLGTNVAAVSDAQGMAQLAIPMTHPRVELLMVEPDHTHWSQFAKGFVVAIAPQEVGFTLQPLVPDDFALMPAYAAHDPLAGTGVRVGVIDSGVGPHADLAVAGGGCFVTGEPLTDFLDNGIGHGTHVAGIIAAKQGANGLYGVAPGCTLMAYRVCPKTGLRGRAQSIDVAAALEQAITDQCDLVNISLGSLQAMPELPSLLEKARNAGMVVFASTGNDGQEVLRYPARYSHTLAVGALGRDSSFPLNSPEKHQSSQIRVNNEFVARFSNYGVGTDFIGLGVAVLSTYPNDRYAMMSGTSMATPFTTGMAARLLSRTPVLLMMDRGPARVDAIIAMLAQATRKPGWPGNYDGFGVLK
nr:S8 family serine peptidase [uncultured Albidiferax sp.]